MKYYNTVSKGSKFLYIKRFFFYSLIFLSVFVILLDGIIQSIETKNITPLINNIGGKLFYTSYELGRTSENILKKDRIFDFSGGNTIGIWNGIKLLSDFFSSILVIFLWIKIFAFMISLTFLSDMPTGQYNFKTWFMALLTYFILQIFFILLSFSLNKSFFNINLSDNIINNLAIPFISFMLFFRVLFLIIPPIAKVAETVFPQNISIINNVSNIEIM